MHIVFQHPAFGGEDEHNYSWALVDATGYAAGYFRTPEAALIEASIQLETDLDTLALAREGADYFTVTRRA